MNIVGILKGFSGLVWLAFFAALAFVVFSAARKSPIKKGKSIILILLVVALVFSTISSGLVFIKPEDRGVVVSAVNPNGYRSQALQPGLHWIIPFAESVVVYPISRQTYTMSIAPIEGSVQGDDSIAARTLDGQEIYVDASIIFSINPSEVVQVHINWQDRYIELIRAQTRGIIRDAVSQYRVEEVVSTKRFELVDEITNSMRTSLEASGLVLDDFVLRNIAFSAEYAASVEQKQIAEQQAQQAKFVVEQKRQEAEQVRETAKGAADASVTKARGEADARLIQAEAEAKALEMIAAVLAANPNLLTYQYITKLSPNVEVMLVPSENPFLLNIPQLGITQPE